MSDHKKEKPNGFRHWNGSAWVTFSDVQPGLQMADEHDEAEEHNKRLRQDRADALIDDPEPGNEPDLKDKTPDDEKERVKRRDTKRGNKPWPKFLS